LFGYRIPPHQIFMLVANSSCTKTKNKIKSVTPFDFAQELLPQK